jgi:hypothetical protein|nr:MAG TPA: hypothetical protein [Crassvirales sp.]
MEIEEIRKQVCSIIDNLLGLTEKCKPENTVDELMLDLIDAIEIANDISIAIVQMTEQEDDRFLDLFDNPNTKVEDLVKYVYDIQEDRKLTE